MLHTRADYYDYIPKRQRHFTLANSRQMTIYRLCLYQEGIADEGALLKTSEFSLYFYRTIAYASGLAYEKYHSYAGIR
jgi:hypothetical protein